MRRPSPLESLALASQVLGLLAAVVCLTNMTRAASAQPVPDLTPSLVVERDVGQRLYGPEADGAGTVLKIVAAYGEAHVGHGSSNNRVPHRPLVLDLARGEARTITAAGRRVPLPEAYSRALRPMRMAAEGSIPIVIQPVRGGRWRGRRGFAHLDYDSQGQGTRVQLYGTDASGTHLPVVDRRIGLDEHNRDGEGLVGGRLVVHHPSYVDELGLSFSPDGGRTWRRVRHTPSSYGQLVAETGAVFYFSPERVPYLTAIDTTGTATVIGRTEGEWWAGIRGTMATYPSRRELKPQPLEGYVADGGVYLDTSQGLYYVAGSLATGRPVRVPDAGTGAHYAAFEGRLFGYVGTALRRLDAGRWTTVATLRLPRGSGRAFVAAEVAISEGGDFVLAGGSDETLWVGFVPADAARPALTR